MPKTKLNCHDRFDRVWSMTQTRQDNNVIDRTSAVYVENEIELSWSIKQSMVYEKNEIGQ